MDCIKGKHVLVIGGTGTVGSALVKRLLHMDPAVIRVFSRDEHKQYVMQSRLSMGVGGFPSYSMGKVRFLLGDVRDKERLKRAMEDIDVVFHLAALKHVPACEYNPFEAVKTNSIGTQNVIECAIEGGVSKVIYASSDKAAGPTNTMGATKLLAERLISAADLHKGPRDTQFFSVRFGNVLNSRGSVVPLFKQQIKAGGPVTVTHPEMTRFFMSVERAVDLILDSMLLARGGETFVFKMPVMRIGDLARAMVIASGTGAEITNIGLRPGEKMFEELMTEEESCRAMETEDLYIILPFHLDLDQVKNLYGGRRVARGGMYISSQEQPLAVEQIVDMLKKIG
ncbi:MAG: polysaccharide biosynthesis protein [Firmicutes bacterium]|nr:polysaccharide biosynthesis protein [Bacillota bacterium]